MIAFGVFFFGCWGRFACCSLERSWAHILLKSFEAETRGESHSQKFI